jgi:DNA polymerase-3 subunit beta
MKFRVSRDALGEAVAFVSRALPARPVVPLLSGLLLQAANDRLTLSCFDYEVSARISVDAEVLERGTALVPGRLLAEITRSLPARPVEFSDEGDVVNLSCGRAEFGLVCLPVEDYPELPESPEPVGIIDGGLLVGAIGQVATSASRDDTLPMLTAICLDIDGQALTLAATDRYRLAAREVPFEPVRTGASASVLVPARVMVEAARTLPTAVPVTIAFGTEGLISFETGDRRITARLIGGEFIKYRSRFGGEFGCRAEIPAGPMMEAVRRASLVADRSSPVTLSFGPHQVVIEAHAEGRARAAETVPAEFSGDQPVISFNPHYLLDGLAAAAAAGAKAGAPVAGSSAGSAAGHADPAVAAAGGEGERGSDSETGRIRLEFNTPAKPALITWAGVPGSGDGDDLGGGDEADEVPAFRYLLVPQRVAERR